MLLFSCILRSYRLSTRRISRYQVPSLTTGLPRCYNASKSIGPTPPTIASLETQNDMNAAKEWAKAFQRVNIPREAVGLIFSRSSGPGGQNVNKVNTKCSARCPLRASFIPSWAKQTLRKNPAYVSSTDTLLVTSTAFRSQAQNVDDCLLKLRSLIVSASLANVKSETPEGQRKKVEGLKKAEKARRRQEKEYQSKKKQMRKAEWD